MAKVERDEGTMKPAPKKLMKKKTGDGDTEKVGYTLPLKKTVPVDTLLGYILLLFGEKKIGKTSMLAEGGDRTFFAFFEPGGKALELYGDVFATWSRFRTAVNQIIASKRFNHVVVDTVDLAYKASVKYTLKRLGIEHQSDEAYGKGWAASREDFEEPIMRLVNAGIAVTFVSHADEKEITVRNGETYTKLAPTMPKQARELVEGLVDIWAYYGYDGQQRVLTIQGDEHISAGHRLSKHFRSADGTPLRTIHMGSTPAESFANFTAAFHNTYVPPVSRRHADEEEVPVVRKKLAFKKKTS